MLTLPGILSAALKPATPVGTGRAGSSGTGSSGASSSSSTGAATGSSSSGGRDRPSDEGRTNGQMGPLAEQGAEATLLLGQWSVELQDGRSLGGEGGGIHDQSRTRVEAAQQQEEPISSVRSPPSRHPGDARDAAS